MTSNGEEDKVDKAKKYLKNAVIGLVIILASWAIATFVISKLAGTGGSGTVGCQDGATRPCGCGGYQVCVSGSWSSGCIGSDPNCNPPVRCSSNPDVNQCTPNQATCAPNSYCDDQCYCQSKGELGDPCDKDLTNEPTCDPDNNRCATYLTCNTTTCKCFGTPIITEVSPTGGFCSGNANQACAQDSDCTPPQTCDLLTPNGTTNNFLTIFGKNFGTYSATSSKLIFEGSGAEGVNPKDLNSSCIDTWTNTQIVIAVPAGAANGPITVIDREEQSYTTDPTKDLKIPDFEFNIIERPGLCSLNPEKGLLSTVVNYSGIKLSAGEAYFGNKQNNVSGLSSVFNSELFGTSTTPNIYSGQTSSFVEKEINGIKQSSNYLKFIKEQEANSGPFISKFDPIIGNIGQYVTITGNGFGGARGDSKVFFSNQNGDQEADYNFPLVCADSVWKDKQIIIKVPSGVDPSAINDYVIKIQLGSTTIDTTSLNPSTFEKSITATLLPGLCKIDPNRGPVKTVVDLWGEYFGPAGTDGNVKFYENEPATGTITIDLDDHVTNGINTTVPTTTLTGPVKVKKGTDEGNGINFSVGSCQTGKDCDSGQTCCSAGTYKEGACVSNANQCFINIPTSVYEWSFSTASSTGGSCEAQGQYYGTCMLGACPNVPGTCSPYAGGGTTAIGDCDASCVSAPGCSALGSCTYNSNANSPLFNRCASNLTCSVATEVVVTYTGPGNQVSTSTETKICNSEEKWEIGVSGSCPDGWARGADNTCVSGSCSLCDPAFTCIKTGENDPAGVCASSVICSSGAICEGAPSKCYIKKKASCDCCCEIGQDARDCCAPLKCEGSCGVDTGKSNPTYGRCGGCKLAGNDAATRDAACNCSGHSGQFCDINNPEFPDGVCSDCSSLATNNIGILNDNDCTDHSSVCCVDSMFSNACRAGSGLEISNNPNNLSFGYCAYYNCFENNNATECASTTPAVSGDFGSKEKCLTDCPNGDPCSQITDEASCKTAARCCFDSPSGACRLGDKIPGAGGDAGFCDYFNCDTVIPTNCASTTPLIEGDYNNISTCEQYCGNPPGGMGLSCIGEASTTPQCDSNICNYPGFSCLLEAGGLGTTPPDCGICCCQPTTNPIADACTQQNPKLKCIADKGSCSGAQRGLCCGCSNDGECGSVETAGCGNDTCCDSRPTVLSTLPNHLATNVCRNAAIRVDFNKSMDITSLPTNVLLLEEHTSGTCPAGSSLAKSESLPEIFKHKNQGWIANLIDRLSFSWKKMIARFSGQALATPPNPTYIYCTISGSVTSEENSGKTSLYFSPIRLLSPSTNYYFVIKGDEYLSSDSGVLSFTGIGMNGEGYYAGAGYTGINTEGEDLTFNASSYTNSRILKFSTLSDQSSKAGICMIASTSLKPVSYLFKTTSNDLDENDVAFNNKTFDTKADRDKVFSAWAYSADKQLLTPTTGYFWNWNMVVENTSVAAITTVAGLAPNKSLVTADSEIVDGETKLTAQVDMANFLAGCTGGNCTCVDSICSNHCCNAYSTGNGTSTFSNLYVFVCDNPWPPVQVDGNWFPWSDNCSGVVGGGACLNYNYKFYYCRDAGGANTIDDLPAIQQDPVIRGQAIATEANQICTIGRTPCDPIDSRCGEDMNGDGTSDGFCVWNVLKESYFFREADQSGASNILAQPLKVNNLEVGGKIEVYWNSVSDQVYSYKVYYLKSGKGGTMLFKEFKPTTPAPATCALSGNIYSCRAEIDNLTNGSPYVFKVSVISVNKVESQLIGESTATPIDKTPPAIPTGLQDEIINSSSTIEFSWNANTDDTDLYRIYRGVTAGIYGESYDSAKKATSISFPTSQFSAGNSYFALSAVDAYGNESVKSAPGLTVSFPIE